MHHTHILLASLVLAACGDNATTSMRDAGNGYGAALCYKIDECAGRVWDMADCISDVESDVCDYAAKHGYDCDASNVDPYVLDECLSWIYDSACTVEGLPDICVQAFRPVR